MALFRRNKADQASVPAELQNYYQVENRERSGVAWLLAIGTVIVTILVIVALFYGGRWVYRKFDNNKKADVVSVQTDDNSQNSSDSSSDTSTSTTSTTTTTTDNTSTTTPTTDSTSTSSQTSTGASVNGTQTTATDLPNTGPGDTLAIFVAVTVLAYVVHRRFTTK